MARTTHCPGASSSSWSHPTVTASGHLVQDDQPLRFAEIIRRFVSAEVEAGSGGA